MSLGKREGVVEERKGEGRGSAKAVSLEAQLPRPGAERQRSATEEQQEPREESPLHEPAGQQL